MRLAMVAGEASGDLLAGLLLKGLKARWPDLSAAGIGGPRMAAQGFEAWWPSDKLAVRGSGQHAECVVGIGDAAVGVAANDHVALRGQKAFRALFRFLEFPVAVGKLLGVLLQRAQLALQRTHTRK